MHETDNRMKNRLRLPLASIVKNNDSLIHTWAVCQSHGCKTFRSLTHTQTKMSHIILHEVY